jgi:hypothetical protein
MRWTTLPKWEARVFLTFIIVTTSEGLWPKLVFSVLCLAAVYMMLKEEWSSETIPEPKEGERESR